MIEGIVLVRDVGRDILPGIQSRVLELAGRHGLLYAGYTYRERRISVTVVLAENSVELLRTRIRNLAEWLRPNGLKPLILTDEPDKFYNAVLTEETDLEQLATGADGELLFLCPDPFAYAITPDVVTMLTSPLVHVQRGTAPADPLLRLQGISSGAGGQQISITIGTQIVTYRGALASGEWLEIDCQEGIKTVVRVVGEVRTNVIGQLERPIFPQLAAGNNTITVTLAGGATWSLLEIHCRNRWF